MTAPTPLPFNLLERKMIADVTTNLANVSFWWQPGGAGSTVGPVLVQGIFDREPSDPLDGMAESFNPTLAVASDSVPGAARGDWVEIDPALQSWFAYYFGQITPRFEVTRCLVKGAGLVVFELRARA